CHPRRAGPPRPTPQLARPPPRGVLAEIPVAHGPTFARSGRSLPRRAGHGGLLESAAGPNGEAESPSKPQERPGVGDGGGPTGGHDPRIVELSRSDRPNFTRLAAAPCAPPRGGPGRQPVPIGRATGLLAGGCVFVRLAD